MKFIIIFVVLLGAAFFILGEHVLGMLIAILATFFFGKAGVKDKDITEKALKPEGTPFDGGIVSSAFQFVTIIIPLVIMLATTHVWGLDVHLSTNVKVFSFVAGLLIAGGMSFYGFALYEYNKPNMIEAWLALDVLAVIILEFFFLEEFVFSLENSLAVFVVVLVIAVSLYQVYEEYKEDEEDKEKLSVSTCGAIVISAFAFAGGALCSRAATYGGLEEQIALQLSSHIQSEIVYDIVTISYRYVWFALGALPVAISFLIIRSTKSVAKQKKIYDIFVENRKNFFLVEGYSTVGSIISFAAYGFVPSAVHVSLTQAGFQSVVTRKLEVDDSRDSRSTSGAVEVFGIQGGLFVTAAVTIFVLLVWHMDVSVDKNFVTDVNNFTAEAKKKEQEDAPEDPLAKSILEGGGNSDASVVKESSSVQRCSLGDCLPVSFDTSLNQELIELLCSGASYRRSSDESATLVGEIQFYLRRKIGFEKLGADNDYGSQTCGFIVWYQDLHKDIRAVDGQPSKTLLKHILRPPFIALSEQEEVALKDLKKQWTTPKPKVVAKEIKISPPLSFEKESKNAITRVKRWWKQQRDKPVSKQERAENR